MITHIRMKNFKSWKDSGEVKLAPLTGFFGANNSGKSSLLQMLLLLKQTIGTNDVIFLGDKESHVNFGDFREVIHDHQTESDLHLHIRCELSHAFPDLIRTPYQVVRFAFDTVIQQIEEKLLIDSLQYKSLSSNTVFTWQKDDLSNVDESPTDFYPKNCYGLHSSNEIEMPKILTYFIYSFEELFSHVFYLGPVREHPKRLYHWEGSHPEDIGRLGDRTIEALLSARIDRKKIQYNEKEMSIEERISEWLRKMDLGYSFLLDRIESSNGKDYDVRIQTKEFGATIALADMGYGLSQFLPVLVLCYYAPEGSTLILEQPGIHLHPKVQSQLADLLIEVVIERKLQILIESHSEHLLTRLQLRIAEGKLGANQTALYFCENESGTSKIKSLELDELGNIKNWPKNFFGNVRGDLTKMTREQIKRQKEAEG